VVDDQGVGFAKRFTSATRVGAGAERVDARYQRCRRVDDRGEAKTPADRPKIAASYNRLRTA